MKDFVAAVEQLLEARRARYGLGPGPPPKVHRAPRRVGYDPLRMKTVLVWVLGVALAVGLIGRPPAEAADPKAGDWTFGVSLGFLGS